MIVQAIGLLDDLDKELNTYAMRVREWYGWHFPEMTKIVADNIKYAKAVSYLYRQRTQGVAVLMGIEPLHVCVCGCGPLCACRLAPECTNPNSA